ncbi:hypothetical protein [Streptomyces paromomycinus]|uniref:Uncharacterized protein n=1 Tax=Streptomyces paromomycinus TaxID=92743 RepID=A0A401W7F8_STREY|nr:hypothetical protein [Streptomyces paromomycinus]GCD45278.1 hypothetical protein GKJPGBOP_05001 [Streptomyces paromomycinus]
MLQWPAPALAWALLVAWHVCAVMANAVVGTPSLDFLVRRYVGPRRFAREWGRNPRRWEDHFRALLPELCAEAAKVSCPPGLQIKYPLRARLRYCLTHTGTEDGKLRDFAFTVPVQHYRGCGPEAARRIARAEGRRILKPGTSLANHVAPEDRQALTLAVPDPRYQPAPPPAAPSGKP